MQAWMQWIGFEVTICGASTPLDFVRKLVKSATERWV
jgi:hypothetical protein